MRPPVAISALLICLFFLLPAASAQANATDNRIVDDCGRSPTGLLTGSYDQAELRHALHNLPGDASDYTGCFDAIRQAIFGSGRKDGAASGGTGADATGRGRGAAGTDGGDASGGSEAAGTSATGSVPEVSPPAGADRPIEVAGVDVAPGDLPAVAPDADRIPPALLVLLALVIGCALTAAGIAAGRRIGFRRRS